MLSHFNGLTLLLALIAAGLVCLAFAIYANRGLTKRYTVRRITGTPDMPISRVVSRHYTMAKAELARDDYNSHSMSKGLYTIQGR